MTDNLFQADQPVQAAPVLPVQSAASATDQYNAYLQSIVNEDGKPKYATVDEALKGAAHAQEYIRSLKAELDAAKAQTEKATVLSDVMEAIKSAKEPVAHQPAKPVEGEDVTALFQKLLVESKRKEKETTNIEAFSQAISASYGDKSREFIQNKARELGVSLEILQTMAKESPSTALTLLGVSGVTSKPNLYQSSVNTSGFKVQQQVPERSFKLGHGNTTSLMSEWERCKQIIQSRN